MQNVFLVSLIILSIACPFLANKSFEIFEASKEEKRMNLIVDFIGMNLKKNGWNNMLCMGYWPDNFYHLIQFLPFTFTVSDIANEDYEIEDAVPYHSNVVVVNCFDFKDFEESMTKIMGLPYWHPHANVILLFHSLQDDEIIAKVFYVLWYYKSAYAAIIRYDDDKEELFLSYYNPYTYENNSLPFEFGCRTAKKIGIPIDNFQEGFLCEENCYNVSLASKFRALHVGTCIGFDTKSISYGDYTLIRKYDVFWPKGKNLHGFPLRAHATEVKPFLNIEEGINGTYTLEGRDGEVWNTISSIMNFTIDLTPSKSVMKLSFDFEIIIQQVFSFSHRKADLLLLPLYLMDFIVAEFDQTFPFKDSGVCLAAHRAGFESILFDKKLIEHNYTILIKFIISFMGSFMVFSVFFYMEKGRINLDQLGKNLLNTVRNTLTITLHKPPKKGSFRIFLGLSLWSYFVLNFASQAAITSFFTAIKKGSEVDTFEDIVKKGYIIEGIASPDVVLPETEERFRRINSKLTPIKNLFSCVNRMKNDSKRFCLIDCAVGRYLERNELNYKGQQFLHIAKDRIHSHYLSMVLPKHSPITEHFNKHMMALVEGGIIRKWEQYRYNDIKEEAPIKALNMDDLASIFKCYLFLIGFSFIIFILELFLGRLLKAGHMTD